VNEIVRGERSIPVNEIVRGERSIPAGSDDRDLGP